MKDFNDTPWILGDESLGSALQVLTNSSERTLFVVSTDHKLIGVITEGDVTRAYIRGQIKSTLASDIMNSSPIHFESALTDSQIAEIFVKTGALLIPIVNSGGQLIGSQSARLAMSGILGK